MILRRKWKDVLGIKWYCIGVLYFYEFYVSCLYVKCMLNKKDYEKYGKCFVDYFFCYFDCEYV